MPDSKPLGHNDSSGFEFVKRVLGNNPTAAINFDRLQYHPIEGYIIFELLKCEASQTVTPYTSHPRRYWNKNTSKFLALWRAKQDFNAKLYLVNYAEEGTKYADQVLVIEVLDMDEINNECLESKAKIIDRIYENKTLQELGRIKLPFKMHRGETIETVYLNDLGYLEWLQKQNYKYSRAVYYYLKKIGEGK